MQFPMDIFWQAMEGNWVAFFAIGVTVACFMMGIGLIILWWKLPDFAKKAFLNNLRGHNPVMVECYENKFVKFQIPRMFKNGLAYDKGAWYIPPKALAASDESLSNAEREAFNSVYSGAGCPAGIYFNNSIQAQVMNPELLLIIQHETQLAKLDAAKKFTTDAKGIIHYTQPLRISTELFKAALDHIKDKEIQLVPMNLNFPIDIKGIKALLPKSLGKSQLGEQENIVRQDERKKAASLMGGSGGGLVILLLVINLILGIVGLLKGFGVF